MSERPYNWYEHYRGQSASEIDFDEFLAQVSLEELDLYFFNARKYDAELGNGYSLDVYSSAWFQDDDDRTSDPVADPEFFVQANYAVNVLNETGQRLARVEAGYHLNYYSFLPMDDKAFVQFSKTRVNSDVWPELEKLVDELLAKLELGRLVEPHFQSLGPMRSKFWPQQE